MGQFTKDSQYTIEDIWPYIDKDTPIATYTMVKNGANDDVTIDGYSSMMMKDSYQSFVEDAVTPKVLRYGDSTDFTTLDYIRGLRVRLAPKRVFERGVLISVEYYADSTLNAVTGMEEFSDMVVCELFTYTRNADDFALYRDMTIEWITEAEVKHPDTKVRHKNYGFMESVRETDTRRKNVIDQVKTSIVGILTTKLNYTLQDAVDMGQAFFARHLTEILTYTNIGEKTALVNSIAANVDDVWLDEEVAPSVSIRMYTIGKLTE